MKNENTAIRLKKIMEDKIYVRPTYKSGDSFLRNV